MTLASGACIQKIDKRKLSHDAHMMMCTEVVSTEVMCTEVVCTKMMHTEMMCSEMLRTKMVLQK